MLGKNSVTAPFAQPYFFYKIHLYSLDLALLPFLQSSMLCSYTSVWLPVNSAFICLEFFVHPYSEDSVLYGVSKIISIFSNVNSPCSPLGIALTDFVTTFFKSKFLVYSSFEMWTFCDLGCMKRFCNNWDTVDSRSCLLSYPTSCTHLLNTYCFLLR